MKSERVPKNQSSFVKDQVIESQDLAALKWSHGLTRKIRTVQILESQNQQILGFQSKSRKDLDFPDQVLKVLDFLSLNLKDLDLPDQVLKALGFQNLNLKALDLQDQVLKALGFPKSKSEGSSIFKTTSSRKS